MDYREFPASLNRTDRMDLTRRSDGPALWNLALHLCLIGAASTWVALTLPLWPLALVALGVFQIFLFTLEHECSHNTAFRTHWLNESVGRIAGLVVLVPFDWFRFFHHEHHRFTQDPDKDPELETPKPETWPALILHLSGIPMWRSLVRQLLKDALGRPGADYVPEGGVKAVQREAIATLVIYLAALATLAVSDAAFWYWLLPIALGQPFLRFYLLAEHGGCPKVPDMFANSRTTLTTRFVRLLAWNMPFHAEHHAYPAVPFHRLPEMHDLARDHIRIIEDGYTGFATRYAASISDRGGA